MEILKTRDHQPRPADRISNMPSGPLDEYRQQAGFSWQQLQKWMDIGELLSIKRKIWHALESDDIFAPLRVTPPLEEQKRRAALQMKRLSEMQLVPEDILKASYKTKTKYIMAVNAATASWDKNLSVKFAVGVTLFANALLSLGTERHRWMYDAVWSRKMWCALAITEISHGSNTKSIRTVAVYDPVSREFVIHTPDFQAAKCWVGNLGKTCTHALLFAQLVTEGRSQGVHAFFVPIRDPETMLSYPGIKVGDVGEKAGLNGIDNGFVMFDHYRIPKDNLLNRTGDVNDDGEYETSFTEPQQILGAVLENLSAGRVAISQESANDLCTAVTIAIRYGSVRRQFAPNQNSEERTLLEYPLHQNRLFPYLAAACVLRVFVDTFTLQYLECVEKSSTTTKLQDLTILIAEVHAIVSACKPLVTWTCASAIQEAREACGGFGYLAASGLGRMRSDHDASVTYEGDNNVLIQQTSYWLLQRWSEAISGDRQLLLKNSPLGTVCFLQNYRQILSSKCSAKTADYVSCHTFVTEAYQWLLCWLLQRTYQKQQKLLEEGHDRFTVRNSIQTFYAKPLSIAYAEWIAMATFMEQVESSRTPAGLRYLLLNIYVLYGLHGILRNVDQFYEGGYAAANFAGFVKSAIESVYLKLKPDSVSVVDAIAPPDSVVKSVLGCADGKVYERLEAELTSSPSVFERASWWKDIAIKPRSKL